MRYSIFSDNSYTPLKIHEIGFSADPTITRFGPGKRSAYIIHYVLSGKGYFNGTPIYAEQGFLITPGQPEHYYPDAQNPWEFLWIVASGDDMKHIFEKMNANPNTSVFNYENISVIRQYTNEILTRNYEICDALKILELFLRIVNSHLQKKPPAKYKLNAEVYLDFCANHVETNLHKKITVHELAALVGVSQPYLYKIFIKKYGISPKEFITLQKINRAKNLLLEKDISITEIANSVGFADVLAFSKAFSAKESVSPQKYRQALHQKRE